MIKLKLDLSRVTPMNRLQIEYLARVAGGFESRVLLEHRNRVVNGKSMLGLLSLGDTGNDPVVMTVEGADEAEASREIQRLLEEGNLAPKEGRTPSS